MNKYYKLLMEKYKIATIRSMVAQYLEKSEKNLDDYTNYLDIQNISYKLLHSGDIDTYDYPVIQIFDDLSGYCEVMFDIQGNYHSFCFY